MDISFTTIMDDFQLSVSPQMRAPSILLLLLAFGYAHADCDELRSCTDALNLALGLTDANPWNNPVTFRNNVEAFYEKDPTAGLRTVCKAFREFKKCMGADYAVCISPSNLVLSSVDPYSAYQFVSTFNTMHYTCGAGFQIYLNNNNCLKQVWQGASAEQLNACRYAFEMKSNIANDNACLLGNTYMTCWESQIQSVCGVAARDTQFWGCEYARINIFTRFPACNNRCVLPYNGGNIG